MRAFVGIGMPPDFQAWFQEQAEPLGKRSGRLKLVPPASCHMTLRFLGEISDEQVTEVAGRLKASLTSVPRMAATLGRFGIFRRNGSPAVLWAGTTTTSMHLEQLATVVAESTIGIGSSMRPEHFEPHVTLGRFVSGTREDDVAFIGSSHMKPYDVRVESIVLYESIMGKGHPVYVTRAVVPLTPFAE